MQDYQERVVDEKKELDGRLERLASFIDSESFSSIDIAERSRLLNQSIHMRNYSQVLCDRIANFKD